MCFERTMAWECFLSLNESLWLFVSDFEIAFCHTHACKRLRCGNSGFVDNITVVVRPSPSSGDRTLFRQLHILGVTSASLNSFRIFWLWFLISWTTIANCKIVPVEYLVEFVWCLKMFVNKVKEGYATFVSTFWL